MFAAKRLGKELQKAKQRLPPGITLIRADDLQTWEMDIQVLDENPIYKNQTYRLQFIFGKEYPISPPQAYFIYVAPNTNIPSQSNVIDLTQADDPPISVPQPQSHPNNGTAIDNGHRPIPVHPHIYTNGIICLDLLGSQGWSPVQSVESVCMSLQSMLTGNTKNERPQGDKEFCASMGPRGKDGWSGSSWGKRGLQDVRFDYDDDTV